MIDYERLARETHAVAVVAKDVEKATPAAETLFATLVAADMPIPTEDLARAFYADGGLIPSALNSPSSSAEDIAAALRSLPDTLIELAILRYVLAVCSSDIRTKQTPSFETLAVKLRPVVVQ